MNVGFAKLDITPPLGVILNGYYKERYADHVIEPLYVTATAYSDGERTVLAVSLDISEILQKDMDELRTWVSNRTGVPFEAIFLACIHTHTAPVISEIRTFFLRDPDYYAKFRETICECAALALKDLRPALASVGEAEAKGISFIRRFRMKDGSVKTNPSIKMAGEIVSPMGTPDETVRFLKLERENAPTVLVVQFATHPDVLGGTGICPDWPGYLRDTLERALADEADGQGVRVAVFNGAEGDVNHLSPFASARYRGVAHSRHMGRVIAGAVLSRYTFAAPITTDRVFFEERMAEVRVAKGSDAEVKIAKEIHEAYVRGEDTSGYPFDIVMARKFLRLEESGETVPLRVSAIGFGEFAFLGLPGEPFTALGREIREASPFRMTFVCCNANGSEGYFPTDDALQSTSYEAKSSLFLPGVAPTLVETAVTLLQGNPPRKII